MDRREERGSFNQGCQAPYRLATLSFDGSAWGTTNCAEWGGKVAKVANLSAVWQPWQPCSGLLTFRILWVSLRTSFQLAGRSRKVGNLRPNTGFSNFQRRPSPKMKRLSGLQLQKFRHWPKPEIFLQCKEDLAPGTRTRRDLVCRGALLRYSWEKVAGVKSLFSAAKHLNRT